MIGRLGRLAENSGTLADKIKQMEEDLEHASVNPIQASRRLKTAEAEVQRAGDRAMWAERMVASLGRHLGLFYDFGTGVWIKREDPPQPEEVLVI